MRNANRGGLLLAGSALAILANAMIIYGIVVEGQDRLGLHPLSAAPFAGLCLAQVAATFPAGVICDHGSRKRLLVLATLALAALAGALPLLSGGAIGSALLIAAGIGFGGGMGLLMTARFALLRDAVPPQRADATLLALNVIAVVANAAGPVAAGLVRQWAPGAAVFAVAAALLLASVALALPLPSAARSGAADTQRSRRHALAGLRYAAERPPVRRPLALMAVTSFLLLGPYAVLMPDYARRTLGLGEAERGLLLGFVGVGFVAGGALAALLKTNARQRRTTLVAALAGVGFGLAQLAVVQRVETALPALALLGIAGSVAWGIGLTALQSATDPAYAGRVMGVYVAIQPTFSAAGGWAFALLAQAISTPAALGVAGTILAAGSVAYGLKARLAMESTH